MVQTDTGSNQDLVFGISRSSLNLYSHCATCEGLSEIERDYGVAWIQARLEEIHRWRWVSVGRIFFHLFILLRMWILQYIQYIFSRNLSIVPCSCLYELFFRPLSIYARFELISGRIKSRSLSIGKWGYARNSINVFWNLNALSTS